MHTNVALGIASAAAFVITHLYVADQAQNHRRYIQYLEQRIKSLHEYGDRDHTQSLDAQVKCLADNIYHEARSESYEGQLAVATVTINRVKHDNFPDTVCQVVWQRSDLGCQFSWTCDGLPDGVRNQKAYQRAWTVAEDAIVNGIRARRLEGNTLFYHANYVRPFWTKSTELEQVATIDRHVFYNLNR